MIIRNVFFYLGLIPVTIFFAIVGLLFCFLPYRGRYYLITRWSHFFIFWAKITCGLRYHIQGLDQLPKEPVVILSNHQSMWETIFMQVILPPQTWILKRQLLNIPVFGWGLRLLKPIAIDRAQRHSVNQLLTEGKKRLEQGIWVIIFPEGTRVAPNTHHRFSRSGAALAEAAQVPVVPLAHNAGSFWPRGYSIKKPGIIKVEIGEPIYPQGKDAQTINNEAEQWIREQLRLLQSTA